MNDLLVLWLNIEKVRYIGFLRTKNKGFQIDFVRNEAQYKDYVIYQSDLVKMSKPSIIL